LFMIAGMAKEKLFLLNTARVYPAYILTNVVHLYALYPGGAVSDLAIHSVLPSLLIIALCCSHGIGAKLFYIQV